MNFAETIEEMIDELEEKKPFLNKQQLMVLAYYYDLLAQEWRDRHMEKPTYPDFNERTGMRGRTPRK